MGDRAEKRPYTAPQVLRLGGGHSGSGSCVEPGSGNTEDCTPGNSASLGCTGDGNTAAAWCYESGSSGDIT